VKLKAVVSSSNVGNYLPNYTASRSDDHDPSDDGVSDYGCSEMLHYAVWHIGTKVSEDSAASIFRLEGGGSMFSQNVGIYVHTA
jgi:hypothetical protein